MPIRIGEVAALYRYPVKSMMGESLDAADLGWHGVDGDRRLALRRAGDRAGFPWLTASKLPEMILFSPLRQNAEDAAGLPTHVRTPEGDDLALFSSELAHDIERRHGTAVEMTHLNRGIFDEASISVIAAATIDEIGRLSAQPPDVRRFRPNVLLTSSRAVPFEEEEWVGGVLWFGDGDDRAAVGVTNNDERCAMVNFDPDSARATPEVLKAIVKHRNNRAGIYGAVIRRGRVSVGQPVFFEASQDTAVAP